MNATETGEPLGEYSDPTLTAIDRGGVIGLLSVADQIAATRELAERQARAITEIREVAEHWLGTPFARRAGKRILRILDEAGL